MASSWKKACPSSVSRVGRGTSVTRGAHNTELRNACAPDDVFVDGVLEPMRVGGGGVLSCSE